MTSKQLRKTFHSIVLANGIAIGALILVFILGGTASLISHLLRGDF